MPLNEKHNKLIDLIDDYGSVYRRQSKNQGIFEGLQMLQDTLSGIAERKRRKKEREEDRKAQETMWADQEMYRRQTDEINRMAESAGKRQDKEEEERKLQSKIAPHQPTIQKINELIAQANMADDDISERQYVNQANSLVDALPAEVHKAYPKFAGLEQRLTQLNTNIRTARQNEEKERRDAAKEEAKNKPKPLGPAQQKLWDELGRKAESAQNEDERLGFYALQVAVEQGEALTSVIKEMREMGGGIDPLTENEQTKAGEMIDQLRQPAEMMLPGSIPKNMQGRGAVSLGVLDPGPVGSGAMESVLPQGAGIDKWATQWARTYTNRVKDEMLLWEQDGYSEGSPHNITNPGVKGRIAKEIDSESRGSRSATEKVLSGESGDGLEQATKFHRAVKAAQQSFKAKGITDPMVMAQKVRDNPDAWVLRLNGIDIEDFINGLESNPVE